ncbi:unnamed protein product [Heterobilharzia americana]|nr:unnamed protein product [Heterobilharzia americana]
MNTLPSVDFNPQDSLQISSTQSDVIKQSNLRSDITPIDDKMMSCSESIRLEFNQHTFKSTPNYIMHHGIDAHVEDNLNDDDDGEEKKEDNNFLRYIVFHDVS